MVLFALPGITQVDRSIHTVKVLLPPDISLDNAAAEYVLFGSFGNHGESVRIHPDLRMVEVNPFVDGILAEKLKMFIWIPGCEIRTFEVTISQDTAAQQTFTCAPLGTVRLTGQVIDMDLLRPAEIQVDYSAYWGCQFFKLNDCQVPTFPIGTAKMDGQGIFQIDLPDFARDPTLANATPISIEIHRLPIQPTAPYLNLLWSSSSRRTESSICSRKRINYGGKAMA